MNENIDSVYFKNILIDLQKDLENRISNTQQHLRHESGPVSADFAEQVTERENDDVVAGLDAMAISELQNVKAALHRIDNGSFGICKKCAEQISLKRLQSIPYADLCKDCTEAME